MAEISKTMYFNFPTYYSEKFSIAARYKLEMDIDPSSINKGTYTLSPEIKVKILDDKLLEDLTKEDPEINFYFLYNSLKIAAGQQNSYIEIVTYTTKRKFDRYVTTDDSELNKPIIVKEFDTWVDILKYNRIIDSEKDLYLYCWTENGSTLNSDRLKFDLLQTGDTCSIVAEDGGMVVIGDTLANAAPQRTFFSFGTISDTFSTLTLEDNIGEPLFTYPNDSGIELRKYSGYDKKELIKYDTNPLFGFKNSYGEVRSFCVEFFNENTQKTFTTGFLPVLPVVNANSTDEEFFEIKDLQGNTSKIEMNSLGYLRTTEASGEEIDIDTRYPMGYISPVANGLLYNSDSLKFNFNLEKIELFLASSNQVLIKGDPLQWRLYLSSYDYEEAYNKPFFTSQPYSFGIYSPPEIDFSINEDEGEIRYEESETSVECSVPLIFYGSDSESTAYPFALIQWDFEENYGQYTYSLTRNVKYYSINDATTELEDKKDFKINSSSIYVRTDGNNHKKLRYRDMMTDFTGCVITDYEITLTLDKNFPEKTIIKNFIITKDYATISANYSQTEEVPFKYYSFYLKDSGGNIVDKKERSSYPIINYFYDGYLNKETYTLDFLLETQTGIQIKKTYDIKVEKIFSDYLASGYFFIKSSEEEGSVKILLSLSYGDEDGIVEDVNLCLCRRETSKPNSYLKPIIKNKKLEQITKEKAQEIFIEEDLNKYGDNLYYLITDYGVKNNTEYEYFLESIFSNPMGEYLTLQDDAMQTNKKILTQWDSFMLYPLKKENNSYALFEEGGGVSLWSFGLNFKEGEISLNQDKTIFTSYIEKPIVTKGELNYASGSLSCLLGEVNYNSTYFEPALLLQKWEDFIKYNSIALYKNIKGDIFIVYIDNNYNRSHMNEVANYYIDNFRGFEEITQRPTTISFNFTEIDEINPENFVKIGE